MTNGGWHYQEQRHGRHRQGATGAAWTPAVRPTDSGPVHARRDGFAPTARPADFTPRPVSEVLTRRPGWPVDPEVPAARYAADVGPWVPAQATGRPPAHAAPEPAWPSEECGKRAEEPAPGRHAAPPKRKLISADMVLDTVPMGQVANRRVAHTLAETTATGLRKFDLGNVPASVTPPRSWRRAAWFTVGTSAAVVLGLTVAVAELMGRPVSDSTVIDALPAYPSGPLTLEKLPHQETTGTVDTRPTRYDRGEPTRPRPSTGELPGEPPTDTVIGSSAGGDTTVEGYPTALPTSGSASSSETTTVPTEPARRTVGAAPVTPTDPQAMGDRTEEYFALVVTDPAAAHALCSGSMAQEGTAGIEARYAGVRRIEVRDITIDRNEGVTTSTVTIVREDGTETVERRQLTFTWGGNPKITDDVVTQ